MVFNIHLQSPSGKCATDFNLFLLLGWRMFCWSLTLYLEKYGIASKICKRLISKLASYIQEGLGLSKSLAWQCTALSLVLSNLQQAPEEIKNHLKEITWTKEPEIKLITYIFSSGLLIVLKWFVSVQTNVREKTNDRQADSINTAHHLVNTPTRRVGGRQGTHTETSRTTECSAFATAERKAKGFWRNTLCVLGTE